MTTRAERAHAEALRLRRLRYAARQRGLTVTKRGEEASFGPYTLCDLDNAPIADALFVPGIENLDELEYEIFNVDKLT